MELLHVVELTGLKGLYCGLEDPTAEAGRSNNNSTGTKALQRTYREAHTITGRGRINQTHCQWPHITLLG
jgi:hypothetical protein